MADIAAIIPPKRLPVMKVEPFPRKRFMEFVRQLKIQTKDFGMVPMELLGTQLYVLDQICEAMDRGVTSFICLKARQLGMTTFFFAVDLFWAFEHAGLLGSFVTHTDQSKAVFRNTIKLFFASLPKTHKIKWDNENRDMIVLKNGSVIQYLVAGIKEKTKGGLGRSSANNYIHCTEVAFWGSPDDLNEISATMSTHYPHRMRIEETTANGFNFFEERWREAKDDPTICTIFVGWWRHDHYRYDDDHPFFKVFMPKGHDTPLHQIERRRITEVKQTYGIDIDRNQIAWYRWKLESELGGDQVKMDEQFPWTEDHAFVNTGTQFFMAQTLTDSMKRARTLPILAYKYKLGDEWIDTEVYPVREAKKADLKIWEEASANGHYVIGCDPAYGSSEYANRTAMVVCRCFADRLVQVAEFASPLVSTYQCAWILAHLAGYYRNCNVNIEINGPGEAVWNELNNLRAATGGMVDNHQVNGHSLRNVLTNMRQFLHTRGDSMAQTMSHQSRTTAYNKPFQMSHLRDSFELRRFIVNSMYLLDEMRTVVIDRGSIEAEQGRNDDRVMAAMLAHEHWRKWVRKRLEGLRLTYEEYEKELRGEGPNQAEKMVLNYLRHMRISIPGITQ